MMLGFDLIELMNKQYISKSESDILNAPITKLELYRGNRGELLLKSESKSSSSSSYSSPEQGTLSISRNNVSISCAGGLEARFESVLLKSRTKKTRIGGGEEKTEIASMHRVTGTLNSGKTKYTIDCIGNVCGNYYIWPESVSDTNTQESSKEFICGSETKKISTRLKSENYGRAGISFCIDGINATLVILNEQSIFKIKSAFIYYEAHASADLRHKVIDIISFIIGRPMFSVACADYGEKEAILNFEISNYSAYGIYAFNLPAAPPYILSERGHNFIDTEKFQSAVSCVSSIYDKHKMLSFNWSYWHARLAPYHIAAVNYGACIERLRDNHIELNPKLKASRILNKEKWKIISSDIEDCIEKADVSEDEKKQIKNKISNLNSASSAAKSKSFFEALNIARSDEEIAAWNARNDSAHGNEILSGSEIKVIQDNRILMVLLHRVVGVLAEIDLKYYDYASVGHVLRKLESSEI